MDIHEYQILARTTAIYPPEAKVIYPLLGLSGEVGEFCNKYKKVIRDDGGDLTIEKHAELVAELGDIFWYLANLAHDLGISLDDAAGENLDKLQSRSLRGVLGGSGDNR